MKNSKVNYECKFICLNLFHATEFVVRFYQTIRDVQRIGAYVDCKHQQTLAEFLDALSANFDSQKNNRLEIDLHFISRFSRAVCRHSS